jgi:hypothetical protein
VFHKKATASIAVVTVVVGSAIVDASKLAPHVIATAEVPVISIIRQSLSAGVPVRLVDIDVIATDCAVNLYTSYKSELIAGVADDVVDPTLAVTLLLVCVSVDVGVV